MSIDKVEVTNSQGNLLTLTLEDISNGYVVEDIDGLDPVKATIVSSNFATIEGQQYQASSRETRNIVIKLGYAPDFSIGQTIRGLRFGLYQFFMTGTPVGLKFYMTDGVTVNTSGRVESCEAPLFSQEPEMDISIICFDHDFIGSLVELHETFNYDDSAAIPFVVAGSTPTGLTSLSFTVNQTLSEFTIYHTTPAGVLNTMLVSAPLLTGDVINMCTVKRQKSITMTRSGITTSLQPQSTWVLLEPGTNLFYLNAVPSGGDAVLLDYNTRYGGL
jgi:hypothetical protein